MKINPLHLRSGKLSGAFAVSALLSVSATSLFALTENEWRLRQTFDVGKPGLIRVELPPATLNDARSNLEDLRIVNAAGTEVPYLIERLIPQAESALRPKKFDSAIEAETTRLTLETGTIALIAGVSLETPGAEFIKSVLVEGSHGGKKWQQISAGQPIFRLQSGATKLRVTFPAGVWEFLRLSIDDRRTQPVPFTGAQLHLSQTPARTEAVSVAIKSRDESPGVTRLALDLGAGNLTLAALQLETREPLFTRPVTLAVPEVTERGINEQLLGGAMIYRVNVAGKSEARLDVPIEEQIHSRELLMFIHNQDSPPLAIDAVHGSRRFVRLVLFAREPGRYVLLSGNRQCAAPRYDLSALSDQLKSAVATEVQPSPIANNPDYKTPEVLAALTLSGANIDVAAWKFRKTVKLAQAGAQQLDPDLEALANSLPDRRDLRLVRDGRQLPFLFEHTSISRSIQLSVTTANDPKKPALSRWSLKLPQSRLPITRLVCTTTSPLFQRDMRLWEEATDERGDKYPRELGGAVWNHVPEGNAREFVIQISGEPLSDNLLLETNNGDNPAIEVHDFRCYYTVTRLVFKAAPDNARPVWLYYGNPEATAPRYDLSLVADQLTRAERSSATVGRQEDSASNIRRAAETLTGSSRYIFWAVLAIVIVALLILMSRLLPKAQ